MARRTGRKINFTHWTAGSSTFVGIAAGTSALTFAAALHEPETILRTRGEVLASKAGPGAGGELALVAVGMILVPEGTGSTVLWSPFTDSDAPWFWYEMMAVGYDEMVTDVIDAPGLTVARRVIDGKAMRISRNQEIQCVLENTTLNGATAVDVTVNARILSGTG